MEDVRERGVGGAESSNGASDVQLLRANFSCSGQRQDINDCAEVVSTRNGDYRYTNASGLR